jgi:WD40 repeat protein
VWQAVREEPAKVPDTPWSEAIRKAVAREPRDRYPSAEALARALEEVALRVTGIEEAQPYPGLASFTEAEAQYFFGREADVEGLWKRLPKRHLLAVVGPSGAGKSSFLRAGLIPAKPEGWAHLICTPGDAPFVALGQALVPEVSRDTAAMRQMLRFEDANVAVDLFHRWRRDHAEALVVVDQFEELFTLSPPEVQARFATLLSRLALEADVHVLLAMRDDFLLRCEGYEALRPIFSDLLPLGAPAGDALRRALVQPALKCGYRFEDEALVADMLRAVEGERGALPLLAFAAASLWDRRDRELGLLTRAAHDAIGGVAGALAQHAEATLDRVGPDRLPLVRELFRNLVTAEGTRAVRDVDELLTVFPEAQRGDAGAVLKALVDARLLTSYEAHATEPGKKAGRRVEVVHESLLSEWPRLVRWRTEDEGGAQIRDQLRQAAHLWEEKGKPEDLLWTGTSFQEYQVWRVRYPGGLSETEETFGQAMAEKAERFRRRRRLAYTAVLAAVVLIGAALGILLHRSVRETRRAEAEVAQREAGQLLALGRLKLADSPNDALAYATASLESADNVPARRFAVEALWQGPPAHVLATPGSSTVCWSADGRWLAHNGSAGFTLLGRDAGQRRQLGTTILEFPLGFTADGSRLMTRDRTAKPRIVVPVWALPEGRVERTLETPGLSVTEIVNDHLLTLTFDLSAPPGERSALVCRHPLDGSASRVLGRWKPHDLTGWDLDPSGAWLLSIQGGRVLQHRLDLLAAPGRVIGTHAGKQVSATQRPWRDRLVSSDDGGEVRIWNVASARLERTLRSPADAGVVALDPTGRLVATGPFGAMPPRSLYLFDLNGPRSSEPVPLLGTGVTAINSMAFSPDGSWLASNHGQSVMLWNVTGPRSSVIGRQKSPEVAVAVTPDGRHVLSTSCEGVLRRWPLDPAAGEGVRTLWTWPGREPGWPLVEPKGRFVLLTETDGVIHVVPLDGSPPRTHRFARPKGPGLGAYDGKLDPSGRYCALQVWSPGHPELNGIRILDLATDDERALDTHASAGGGCQDVGGEREGYASPSWLADGRLVTDGDAGLRVWDLAAGTSDLVRPCRKVADDSLGVFISTTPDSKTVVGIEPCGPTPSSTSRLSAFDLASRTTREITSHGNQLVVFALDASGTILVTGDRNGVVRVGRLTGESPHLLFGHTAAVTCVAVTPDGRQIVSASDDGTIRLWPMPALARPPLHTLPHDELMAKLKSLTNLRAVRDPASDNGWKIEIGPFPGWAVVPRWEP